MNKDKNKLIPELRFTEFEKEGEWKEKSIQKLINENEIVSHLDGNHGALYPRAEEFSKEGIPYISANDFITGLIDFSKCKYLPVEKAKKFRKGVAKDGDILFAHNATVGPVAKLKTDFPFVVLSTTATYFRCDNKNLNNDFLMFALMNPTFVRQYSRVMSQSTRNQIPITAQRIFILQIPKPDEQQKIASCLSSLDEVIAAHSQKLDALKEHKKGLMQNLFPQEGESVPRYRFKEFENDGNWMEKKLESLCLGLSSGKDTNTPDAEYQLYGSTGIIGSVKHASYDGDFILVARVGANAGLLNRGKGKFGVTDNTLVIDLKKEEVIDFVFYSLENIELNKMVFGSGQPLITGGQLKSLNLYIPPKSKEQQKIASCLSSLDELITAQGEKIAQLKLHKKGLMQGLFPKSITN